MDDRHTALDPQGFRDLFPSLTHTTHVASCSFTPPSTPLLAAVSAMMSHLETGTEPWHFYEAELDRTRRLVGSLIGSPAENVAVLPNASTAAFQSASTVDWSDRTTIVASRTEFPSLAQVWHTVATAVRLIEPEPDGAIATGDYLAAIDSDTGLVSVPLVAYRNGARVGSADLAAIAARAHEVGAVLLVDAYQALGVLPCDVTELPCDFLVGGSMKYLLGLPGVAFLCVREPGRGRTPTLTGWFGRPDPFGFDPTDTGFPAQARRFETGTPQFPLISAANAGLEIAARLDPHRTWRHVGDLVRLAGAELAAAGATVISPKSPERQGPMVALGTRDAGEAASIADRLSARAIVASPRGDVVRLAFHYFNTEDDVQAITTTLWGNRAG